MSLVRAGSGFIAEIITNDNYRFLDGGGWMGWSLILWFLPIEPHQNYTNGVNFGDFEVEQVVSQRKSPTTPSK